MKIGLQTWGSEGDIRPFIALSAGLVAAGHQVELALTSVDNKNYQHYAQKYGFNMAHVGMPVLQDEAQFEDIGQRIVLQKNPLKQARLIIDELLMPVEAALYAHAEKLCQENELLVGHYIHHPLRIAAEYYHIPNASISLAHNIIPSSYIPPTGVPNLGRLLNRVLWKTTRVVLNMRLLSSSNALRARLKLPAATDLLDQIWSSAELNLIAVSPVFCQAQPDWDPRHQVCGFLNLPDDDEPQVVAQELQDYIEAGSPPVYFTFGSLTPPSAELRHKLAQQITDAVTQTNCRAIIQIPQAGSLGLCNSDTVHYVDQTPHNMVFSQCAAVIHHGGAGTTQAATRAGTPSIVVPHIGEQAFWGTELRRIGIAPALVTRQPLCTKKLAARIRQVLDTPKLKQQAQQYANTMASEQGVSNAVAALEKLHRAG